ncbi:conserved hypothetical protein [Perkinsus marinus ATCC 50983]|uniref:carnosine N-methyltransferase n=1 Tax=Perkinsus marinus (strain ATCC 50983 / TXsc) TaxID=423536 RepID=C5M095_PERM5|nr:conserved hypothetical protein [Perkinsus marinus ATCC 50983]EEQ97584.1 conserved hypothetical protein [Perkinsus marinus ATCC 50983]|eukprot:XP_002764867.1 conserved hypothetical protein [Perkinsus marinus ATCC 50983]
MGVSPSVLQAAELTYASYRADLSVAEVVYAEEVALALAMYQYEAQEEVRRIARSYASLSDYDTQEICRVAGFGSTGEFAVGRFVWKEWQILPMLHEPAQKVNTPLHYRVRLLLSELTRDWSAEGEEEREQSYAPLVKELPSERCSVLVPGCGTGRLVYDVAVLGHDVEANDFDVMKLAAANAVISGYGWSGPIVIEPYCLDTCNRMKRDDHIRTVTLPDCEIDKNALSRVSVNGFEFTEVVGWGEIVGKQWEIVDQAYGSAEKHEAFDIVLTAAFVDTAPNVFAYIKTIANVLKPGGRWVNTGPLGWLYDGDRFNAGRDGVGNWPQNSGVYESLLLNDYDNLNHDVVSGAHAGQEKAMELNLETALADGPGVNVYCGAVGVSPLRPEEAGDRYWGSPGWKPNGLYSQVPDTPLSSRPYDANRMSSASAGTAAPLVSSSESLLPGSPPGWTVPDFMREDHVEGSASRMEMMVRSSGEGEVGWEGPSRSGMNSAVEALMQQAALSLATTGGNAVTAATAAMPGGGPSHQQTMLALLLSSTAMRLVANASINSSGAAHQVLSGPSPPPPPPPPLYPPPGLAASTAVQGGKIGDDVMRERAVEAWREASSKEEEEEEANIWGGSDREEMSITWQWS